MAKTTKLIFTLSDGSEQKYSLSREGTYTIGTSKSCDIALADVALEKEHGKLVADETSDTRWFLQILADSSIEFLEDGTEKQLGHTHLRVSVIEEEAPDERLAKISTAAPPDNENQLEQLQKAQQLRDLKSATILVIVCGMIAFAAGVGYRIITS